MNQLCTVSIIINNYNYDRFLGEAIDSALRQTHRPTEVIVVDDGSTDGSQEIIAAYGNSITAVLKTNGGQASAFNVGFARSHGEIVIFLDADDVLLPDMAARAVAVYRTQPYLAIIQFRLELMNAEGALTGLTVPPKHVRMPNGDLRHNIRQLNNNTWWSPTSGNAFTRPVLQRVLPMPEFGYSADYYLSRASALAGPVTSVDSTGGHYRFHEANSLNASTMQLDKLRLRLRRICEIHLHLNAFATSLGIDYPDEPVDILDVMFLSERISSLKLAPQQHPIQGDTLLALSLRGTLASLMRVDVSLTFKLLHVIWFWAMVVVPKPLALWLVNKLFYAQTRRGCVSRLLKLLDRHRVVSESKNYAV